MSDRDEQKYRVVFFQDSEYEVVETKTDETVFKGELRDCDAWIRLHNEGYMG